jgi:hypothetical protein
MARTEINSGHIKDGGVKRTDLNTADTGSAVTTKIVAGSNITLSSTGIDAGTGDVTVNVPITFSRGATIYNNAGITTTVNIIVWRAPFACTVTAVKGYRVGGTTLTVNARKNGASNHLSSAVSVSSADTWVDGGAVQNTSYAAGDKLEIMIVTVSGSPTQIAIQVDFTKP